MHMPDAIYPVISSNVVICALLVMATIVRVRNEEIGSNVPKLSLWERSLLRVRGVRHQTIEFVAKADNNQPPLSNITTREAIEPSTSQDSHGRSQLIQAQYGQESAPQLEPAVSEPREAAQPIPIAQPIPTAQSVPTAQVDPTPAAQGGLLNVELPRSRVEKLQTLNFASTLHVRADLRAAFDIQSQEKLKRFIGLNTATHYKTKIFGLDQLPGTITFHLAAVSTRDTPPKSLGTYIYITGLVKDEDIKRFHLAVSRKEIQRLYAPLKLCYDRSVVNMAARDQISSELSISESSIHVIYPHIPGPMNETSCGTIVRTTSHGSTWDSTVGGLVWIDGSYYLMTGGHHGTEGRSGAQSNIGDSELLDQQLSISSNETLVDDNFDETAEQALVLDYPAPQDEKAGASKSQEAGEPIISHQDVVWTEPVPAHIAAEGAHWRLLKVPKRLLFPNSIQTLTGDREYIQGFTTTATFVTTSVSIHAGNRRVVRGLLIGCASFLALEGTVLEVWAIEVENGQDTGETHLVIASGQWVRIRHFTNSIHLALRRGDSGSWVIDDHTYNVLGSIVAISESRAYMISFSEQAKQMRSALNLPPLTEFIIPPAFELFFNLAQQPWPLDRRTQAGREMMNALWVARRGQIRDFYTTEQMRFAQALNAAWDLEYEDEALHLIQEVGFDIVSYAMDLSTSRQLNNAEMQFLQRLSQELESTASPTGWDPRFLSLTTRTRHGVSSPKKPHLQPQQEIVPDIITAGQAIPPKPDPGTKTAIVGSQSRSNNATHNISRVPRMLMEGTDEIEPPPQFEAEEPPPAYKIIDPLELEARIRSLDADQERVNVAPEGRQLISRFSIVCLVLNRAIGSGIFVQPTNVLLHMDSSSGVSIFMWFIAGVLVCAIMCCWLELGLTIPRYSLRTNSDHWEKLSVPRSGGEKNYLEYIFKRPRFLITCVFGITYIVFSNLAAEAIQFGISMQTAVDPTCLEGQPCFNKNHVLGWAVGAVSFCAFLNIFTRRYQMLFSNALGMAKLLFIIATVILGIAYSNTHGNTCRNITWSEPSKAAESRTTWGTYSDGMHALLFAMYAYAGFDQPFHLLAEVHRPKKTFARSVITAMVILVVLFPLTNVAYFCVLPHGESATVPRNIALAFYSTIHAGLSGNTISSTVERPLSALLAIFTLGSIMAQTFTSSRVVAEVAKEGILPYSSFFATGRRALLSRFFYPKRPRWDPYGVTDRVGLVPIGATYLHWVCSLLLLFAVWGATEPSVSYDVLSSIRTLAITCILGLLTVAGLIYLKYIDSWTTRYRRSWKTKTQWVPYLDPAPALIACIALALVTFGTFVPPDRIRQNGGLGAPFWVLPVVGWGFPVLGVLWWAGLRFVQWRRGWRLVVTREPCVEVAPDGEVVQTAEIVTVSRVYEPTSRRGFTAEA